MSTAFRRLLAVTLAALVLVPAAPARAGGWALTVLDPLPARLAPGQAYPVGMWLLQHGYHPYEGDNLGAVELRLVGVDGRTTAFPATPLEEKAHFTATLVVPAAGAYTVVAKQGWFPDYRIGTLTVPGTVEALPVPVELTRAHIAEYWPEGAHPPILPVDPSRDVFNAPAAVPPSSPPPMVEAATPVPAPSPTSRLPLLAGLAALVLAGAVLLGRRRASHSR